MKLEKLTLAGFRNHGNTNITCSPTVNLIVGRNGQGKTNILEAIAYLSIGKSFFSAPDNNLVRRGDEGFVIHGAFKSDNGIGYNVGIRYTDNSRKKEVRLNGKEEDRISSLIGKFPVVILYPEQHAITNGGPAERRRFLDLVLSQAHASYFEMLTEYRRILRQRNSILAESRNRGPRLREVLEPWDEPFLDAAIGITEFRSAFLRDMQKLVEKYYNDIIPGVEVPAIQYEASVPFSDEVSEKELKERTFQSFASTFDTELRYGTTVFGPHRDEIVFTINDLEVRKYASQGQQKSFLVALKISESQYLLEKRNEQPLILLDDLFGELDKARAGRVLELTTGMGQTFVTSADEMIGETHYTSLNGHVQFNVHEGSVSYV